MISAPRIAGVDEAGRGPLAGPVTVAAVILDPAYAITGLADSKKLSEARRVALAAEIRARALAVSVVHVEVAQIDADNILAATLAGMQQAVAALSPVPDQVLVDGNQAPILAQPVQALVGGDGLNAAISAASILAKVSRDALMVAMDAQYPGYEFARHKGYGTAVHLAALERLGPCPQHRRSFAPVRRALHEFASAGADQRPVQLG